jgi:hypothetical protein
LNCLLVLSPPSIPPLYSFPKNPQTEKTLRWDVHAQVIAVLLQLQLLVVLLLQHVLQLQLLLLMLPLLLLHQCNKRVEV